jgi:hypothetical protein
MTLAVGLSCKERDKIGSGGAMAALLSFRLWCWWERVVELIDIDGVGGQIGFVGC